MKVNQFGADCEADKVLESLPRTLRDGVPALVWIDAAGRLNIEVEGEGRLYIEERHLAYVKGDELV